MSEVIQGLEAINYQVKSNLGNDLAKLFQDMLIFKQSVVNDPEAPSGDKFVPYILDSVHKYWKEIGTKRFRDIVKQHCNLRIESFKSYGGSSQGLSAKFAICIDISNASFGTDLKARQTGKGRVNHPADADKIDLAADFKKIADTFDKVNGKLGVAEFEALGSDVYIPYAVIDTNTAFCIDLFIGKDDVVESFTPRELAAIYLHELGHALSMLEHCNDLFYVKDRLENFAINMKEVSDTQRIEAFKTINTEVLPEFRKTIDRLPAEYQSRSLETSINLLSKVGDTAVSFLVEDRRGFFGKIGTCILLWFNFLLAVVSHAIAAWIIYSVCSSASRMEGKANGSKISDSTRNARNASMAERWADQMVARHGFGVEHLEVLRKLHILERFFNTYTAYTGKIILFFGGDLSTIGTFAKMTEFFHFERRMDPAAYEGYIERMSRIVEDTYSFFKYTDNVPAEVINDWYFKVKKMKKVINSERNYMDSKTWSIFTGILKDMTSPGRWADLMTDGNLYDDVTRFVDQLDKLNNNQLFMFGDRLKNIN